MSHPTVVVDRLVISVKAFRREATGEPGVERLLIDFDVKNPVGSPGSAVLVFAPGTPDEQRIDLAES